jgi:NAD(P)-dependent dehydrogenase (short-subunit alcohol dehydrogenase family)
LNVESAPEAVFVSVPERISAHLAAPPATAPSNTIPRLVPRAVAEPQTAPPTPLDGLILVTEDALGVAPILLLTLRSLGAQPVLIDRAALASAEDIRQEVARARALHGPVRGLVHLAALEPSARIESLDAWRRETGLQVKSLFEVLRHSVADFEELDGALVLAATLAGGLWGRDLRSSSVQSAPGGGAHGILATLVAELPRVTARTVDLDPASPVERMAAQLAAELLPVGPAEVGYPEGRRTVFRCLPVEVDHGAAARDWKPRAGWVVLVTGGARGITARIARELAGPGVRLILVGRGELPGELSGPPEALRAQLVAEVRANSSKLKIAEIDAQVREAQRGHERAKHIAALRALGAEVEYHALDVAEEESFTGLIDGIYSRFGRLDAVVHGAGVIEDKLLGAKSRESFDRVFDTKADSAFLLSRCLRPEGLRWVVLFGSVSGRFGNPGQCDYAAANEGMNRLAWQMAGRWPQTRVVTINWGPWASSGTAGGGMAEGAVARLLEERGIALLDPEAACRFFADELAFGAADQAEVVAGDGPWSRPMEPTHESEPDAVDRAVGAEA